MAEVVEYRPIPGLPADKFRVGSDGTIWRCERSGWKQYRQKVRKSGCQVSVYVDGKYKTLGVALCVTRAFHGPRPLGCSPFRFPDLDPTNNRADNLRWAPRGSTRAGIPQPRKGPVPRGSEHYKARLTEENAVKARAMVARGFTIAEVAEKFGVTQGTISFLVKGSTWKHLGGPITNQQSGYRNGSRNHFAKLTEDDVIAIRRMKATGASTKDLARQYRVSSATIERIVTRKIWAHVPDSLRLSGR